jgi:hypothetical protein
MYFPHFEPSGYRSSYRHALAAAASIRFGTRVIEIGGGKTIVVLRAAPISNSPFHLIFYKRTIRTNDPCR